MEKDEDADADADETPDGGHGRDGRVDGRHSDDDADVGVLATSTDTFVANGWCVLNDEAAMLTRLTLPLTPSICCAWLV